MKTRQLKDIGYVLAIVVLFVPVVQLALSTFIDSPDYPHTPTCFKGEVIDQECEDMNRETFDAYEEEREASDTLKFIFASLIGLGTILITIFAKLNPIVKGGLFAGAVFNEFFSIVAFNIEKSLIGWILLAVLFVLVVWFINRDTKK